MSETAENPDSQHEQPFSNGSNGRRPNGRFAPGNPGGPGNPGARHARQLRERLVDAMFTTCSRDRLLVAVDAVLKRAEAGDIAALKLLMERIAGPPVNSELAERIEALEAQEEIVVEYLTEPLREKIDFPPELREVPTF